MESEFQRIDLRVPPDRIKSWENFLEIAPEYSIGIEVMDDTPGHRGHYVHFDHHDGVIREVTMSAAMQAYIAVRQGRLMEKWLRKRRPVPVYVWNADQDVCLATFVLEYHHLLERAEGAPLLRWIVQYNNKIDLCAGMYPVNIDELVRNHFTWVFEPYHEQRKRGKSAGDADLVKHTIRQVCDRLLALLEGRAGIAPVEAKPEILYTSPFNFIIADEKGDPNSRLVLAAKGHTNLISLVCSRPTGRYTYSIIRGSPYDEDVFQVTKLIEAFQAAEDRPDTRIWGGSNLAAGSDSELGSSLHWTQLRAIAEPIVKQAYYESFSSAAARIEREKNAKAAALVVGPEELTEQLRPLLENCEVEVLAAANCGEAGRIIRLAPRLDVVFSPMRHHDGSFQSLMAAIKRQRAAVPMVVCLPETDGGWLDLLEAGARQVMVEPYRQDRIARLIKDLTGREARAARA